MEQNNKNNQPAHQKKGKAVDKAGIGQTDEEKGISPKEVREQKKKELEEDGNAVKRPVFHRDDDELPVQVKNDD